jgi:plasmid stability protein
MADMLVRELKPETLAFFKDRARRHNRSLQAEVKTLLEDTEQRERARVEENWTRVRALRDSLRGRIHSDSAELIREDRDSR